MHEPLEILIVDDVRSNLQLLGTLIQGVSGCEARLFSDPVEALAWYECARPDLVLVDYSMPSMRGDEFVRRLRTLDYGSVIPIVVVTARTDRETLLQVFEAGANDFIRKPVDPIEFMARVGSLAKLGRAARKLFDVAASDELTGLDSRRRFLARLEEEISRAKRYDTPLSLIAFDIDHFKQINDRGGHAAGDTVLVEMGRRIAGTIREVDFAGRMGGEEFCWALPSTDLNAAVLAAERLRRAIEDSPFDPHGSVTVSFGVATLKADEALANLIGRADTGLYAAKRAGRNRVIAQAP